MAKINSVYKCEQCGFETSRWEGKCAECGEWNTLKKFETGVAFGRGRANSGFSNKGASFQTIKDIQFKSIKTDNFQRHISGMEEFDRVLGGGLVPGSVVLIAGSPGIGKSTLILQAIDKLNLRTLYVSGEESAEQIKGRSDRLGLGLQNISFAPSCSVESLIGYMSLKKVDLVVVDSIQTIWADESESQSGSLSQIKLSAARLMEAAKSFGVAVVLVGHVTKDGNVAGPKTLEHIVDVVIYLEGDKYHEFRILRASKNRFGSTNEIGVFDMTEKGFEEVKNPSKSFLEERAFNAYGSVVTATIEGTRPILLEVQGLTSLSPFGYPKRTAVGLDINRVSMLSAVLSRSAGVNLSNQDVYVNVVGGFRVAEPATDLAVCISIASSFFKKPINSSVVAFGEVGLSGEVRRVARAVERVKEAKKLGFKQIICRDKIDVAGIKTMQVESLKDALKKLGIKR